MACALPSWASWYKKPSYVDLKAFAASLNKRAEDRHEGRLSPRDSLSSIRSEESIPQDLSLERVLANKTCEPETLRKSTHVILTRQSTGSPMSLYDFYMYLKHIEYSQENLEFYFWYDRRLSRRWIEKLISAYRFKDFEQRCKQRSIQVSQSGGLKEAKIEVVSVAPSLESPVSEQCESIATREDDHEDAVPQICK